MQSDFNAREFGQDCFSISSFASFSLITLNTIINILSNLNSNDNNNNNNNNNNHNLNTNMNLGRSFSNTVEEDTLQNTKNRAQMKYLKWIQVTTPKFWRNDMYFLFTGNFTGAPILCGCFSLSSSTSVQSISSLIYMVSMYQCAKWILFIKFSGFKKCSVLKDVKDW